MEESKKKPKLPVQERLDRIEHDIEEIRVQVALLERSGTGAQKARETAGGAIYAEAQPQEPVQRYCMNCHGGNPPGAPRCMWCGWPMPQKAPEPVRGAQPLAGLYPSGPLAAPVAQPIPPPPPMPVAEAHQKHVPRWVPAPKAANAEETRYKPTHKVALMGGEPVPLEAVTPPPLLPAPPPTAPPTAPLPAPGATPQAPAFNFDFLKTSEFWLNKVGIGLLLLGLAFFFKYSIDRGWLNEPVRVALGLLVGSVLLGFGLATHPRRPLFSQVLLGGSVASYYITGYAAYELFNLVPYAVGFGFMALVTALAFALALRENEAALSLIGVVGGLLTPFVLTAPSAGVVGLVAYTCIVLAGVAAIYLYKGWRSLLWAGYAGGWLVFGVAWLGSVFAGDASIGDRWALQAAALFCLAAFWIVPVLREALYTRNPERWSRPTLDRVQEFRDAINRHVFLLAVATPLLTLGYSRLVWGDMVSTPVWGWLTLAVAVAYGGTAWLLRPGVPFFAGTQPGAEQDLGTMSSLAYTHVLMAILLLTLGIAQIFQGDALILSLAVEATALHFVSRRLSDRGTAAYGHLISLLVVTWLGGRILVDLFAQAGLTPATLTDLAVIALIAASSFAVWPKEVTPVYRVIVHLAVMGWTFALLYGLPNWAGLIMLTWAAYAMAIYGAHLLQPARFGNLDMGYPAHAIFTSAGVIFAWTISTGQVGEWAVLNVKTLIDAAFVAMVATMSFLVTPREVVATYRIAAHLGVLALLWRELSVLPGGMSYVMLSWGAYAMAIYVAHLLQPARFRDVDMAYPAHAIFASAGLMFAWTITTGQAGEWVVLNVKTLIDAAFLGMVVAMSFLVTPKEAVATYRIAAHLGILALLWRELSVLPDGLSYVMVSWAAYGLGMHYLARRLPEGIESKSLSIAANVPFVGVALWFMWGLTAPAPEVAVFNLPALLSLASIGLAIGASFLAQPRQVTLVYWLGTYLAGLGWLGHEFWALPNGEGYIILSWAALAAVLLYLARRVERFEMATFVGAASATLGLAYIWLLWRLLAPVSYDTPVLNPAAASDLAVIGLLALSAYLVPIVVVKRAYLLGAHIALLAWFWRELGAFENGNAYVTIAWGAYAIALLVAGLRSNKEEYNMPVVYTGIATLLLVVGKLFLVDLAALDPLWRVLLFMGFGGVFLLLSYFFQNVMRGKPGAGSAPGRHGFNFRWPGRPAH